MNARDRLPSVVLTLVVFSLAARLVEVVALVRVVVAHDPALAPRRRRHDPVAARRVLRSRRASSRRAPGSRRPCCRDPRTPSTPSTVIGMRTPSSQATFGTRPSSGSHMAAYSVARKGIGAPVRSASAASACSTVQTAAPAASSSALGAAPAPGDDAPPADDSRARTSRSRERQPRRDLTNTVEIMAAVHPRRPSATGRRLSRSGPPGHPALPPGPASGGGRARGRRRFP